jgi:hypothetical protein
MKKMGETAHFRAKHLGLQAWVPSDYSGRTDESKRGWRLGKKRINWFLDAASLGLPIVTNSFSWSVAILRLRRRICSFSARRSRVKPQRSHQFLVNREVRAFPFHGK